MKTQTATDTANASAQIPLDELRASPNQQLVQAEPTPANLIAMAIQQNIDPDKLTKLFDLHERNEKMKAVIAYNIAMNTAQAKMPIIRCDSHNKQTNSNYASVESLNRAIKPIYGSQGFSLSFGEGTAPVPEYCRTTCEVRHIGGHSEQFYLDLPLDGKGIKGNANMTAIHGRLSSDTYAQGRLLRKIFNLTISEDDSDNDGNDASVITPEQLAEVNAAIKAIPNFNLDGFLKWLNVDSVEKIQSLQFAAVMKELKRRQDEGPALKAAMEHWIKWFDADPQLEELNVVFLGEIKKMADGAIKDAVWKMALTRTKKAGLTFANGKFVVKGEK